MLPRQQQWPMRRISGLLLAAFMGHSTRRVGASLCRSVVAGDMLDGVNVGSLALMTVVTVQLGIAAIMDVTTIMLGLASAVMLVRYRVNSTWLVLGGAVVGLIAFAAW